MKIMITGAGGFIGSHLTKKLLELGHEVVAVDTFEHGYKSNLPPPSSKLTIVSEDIKHITSHKVKDIDIIFHFAAISNLSLCEVNPVKAYEVNTLGTLHLLDTCRKYGPSKFIFASTSALYNYYGFPTVQFNECSPLLTYSMSKYHSEELCRSFRKMYGLETLVLRFFNIYGPNQDSNRDNPPVIPYFIKCLNKNQSPIIYGDGSQRRSFLYIDDAIDACIKCLDYTVFNKDFSTFDIGHKSAFSIESIFDILASMIGKPSISPTYMEADTMWDNRDILFDEKYIHTLDRSIVRKETIRTSATTINDLNNSRLFLDWVPSTSLVDGLQRCIDFYRE